MAVTSADLVDYLNNPPDCEADLTKYINAAKSKARGAGIPDFKHNALYDEFILALAAMYYENRGMSFSGSYQATAESNARKLVNSYVIELRYATEDPVGEVTPSEQEC